MVYFQLVYNIKLGVNYILVAVLRFRGVSSRGWDLVQYPLQVDKYKRNKKKG